MTNFLTPDEAREKALCPLSRTFGTDKLSAKCRGEACALWRWKPRLASDPEFVAAVRREIACMQQDGEGSDAKLLHKAAVERVTRNPSGYGVVSTHGYCGLGGLPT